MKSVVSIAALTLLAGLTLPASAASSDWFETEGGEIRLVTASMPANGGPLKGALEIVLKPGWKTYWMDPGDAGVPPQIDTSASRNVSGATIRFPAPQRFDDGYAVWAGYKDRVALALEFETGDAPIVEADLFLGICEKICIPVQARLSLDPANQDASDDALVENAFSALPGPPAPEFRLGDLAMRGDVLHANVSVPGNGEAQLFVASAHGWYFGTPRLTGDGAGFEIPVIAQPKQQEEPVEIDYTLVSGDDAVSGRAIVAPPAK